MSSTEEEWRPTLFPGYLVSSFGRVRGARGGILRPGLAGSRRDYPFVMCGRGNSQYVHTLVLIAWSGPRPEGMHAAHGDGNPSNNVPDNLRWATPVENARDKFKHGTNLIRGDSSGEKNGRAKLNIEQVREIKGILQAGTETISALSRKYGVSRRAIQSIRDGTTWKEVK